MTLLMALRIALPIYLIGYLFVIAPLPFLNAPFGVYVIVAILMAVVATIQIAWSLWSFK